MIRFFSTLCLSLFLLGSSWAAEIICTFNATQIKPGDIVRVDIFSPEPVTEAHIRLFNRTHKFLKRNEGQPVVYHYYMFFGVPRHLKSQTYQCKVTLKSNAKTVLDRAYEFNLLSLKKGKKSNLKFKSKKNKIVDDRDTLSKEGVILSRAFKHLNTRRYFDQTSFEMPCKGPITSPFGASRQYNGSYSRYHSGVDIGNKKGTRINAPQNGRVTLIKSMKIHGKTVVIDHGLGIASVFSHLSKVRVQTGQYVSKGSLIGEVGMTGLATGPHLHWGVSIGNVRVNPMLLVQQLELVQ